MSTDTATMDNIANNVSAAILQQSLVQKIQDTKQIKRRRSQREKLLMTRLIISKCLLFTSVASILVMIVNTQLILSDTHNICSESALAMKIAVTGLTGFLILFLWLYNYVQIEIFRNLRNIKSRLIAWQVSSRRTALTILETIITIPHPLPICIGYDTSSDPPFISEHKMLGEGEVTNTTTNFTTTTYSTISTNVGVLPQTTHGKTIRLSPLDAVLSILMFLRLYQIGRFTVLHSKLFRTMLSYSLGALTHTKYNFSFIFKSYMAIYKGYFLCVVALTCTTIAAWCIYICDKEIAQFADSLWVVYITFFTVGYGDMSPVSACSQIIAVLTGFSGMFFMGISVTVLSRYLQLTYDEYCMLSFFIDADLQKKMRETSAIIIQRAWTQYKEGKTPNTIASLRAQRNLIKALHYKKYLEYQRVSGKERREKQVPLYDMKEQMKKLSLRTDHVFAREANLVDDVQAMTQKLHEMQEKLSVLYKLTHKEKRPSLRSTSAVSVESYLH